MTVSDTVTTSFDSFTLLDTHWISGYESAWFSNATEAENWLDYGTDLNTMSASGTEDTTGDSFTFVDTDSSSDEYVLNKTVDGQYNAVVTQIDNAINYMSGKTSTGPSGSSYTYYTSSTFSDVDNGSGDVTAMGVVTPFAFSTTTTLTNVLEVSSPPVATVTVEAVSGSSNTGGIPSGANVTETTTAGHADTVGNSVAEKLGNYNVYHAVHDGANEPTLDSSQSVVSALGGQDANAMEFVGPEVHAAPNAANNALVIDEGWSGASPITPWVSHPAAIGYRRQGAISIGSGSGIHIKTIAAVAPEFDSGMNDGTDGQEQERVANFYTGAEENPTSAKSAPTPRAEEQTGGIGGPGGGPSMGGIMDPSSGKEPTWTPAFNPYSGHGYYNPFAGWSLPSFWPFGGGDDGGTGGIPNLAIQGPNRCSEQCELVRERL